MASMIVQVAVVAGVAMLGAGHARAASMNGADVTKEIQAFCQQYDNTWNTKGAVAVANTFFTDDVVFMPPNGAVVNGKATLAKIWGDVYKEPSVHKCTVTGAHAEGDGAWAYGEVLITDPSGKPTGHVSWAGFETKQSGQWKVQMLHTTIIAPKDKE
jgi:uncharacterized protein (TIGR02246 family)